MNKIHINISNHTGRPAGTTKSYLSMRNGYVIKAYYMGFSCKAIAKSYELHVNTVRRIIKSSK